MRYLIVVIVHLFAVLQPFTEKQSPVANMKSSFVSWPTEFERLPLIQLAMTDKERGFNQGFPGKIGRFTDGSRELIFRFVDKPSRKVHASADCLQGSGYNVKPQPLSRDQNDQLWGCVLADREGVVYKVCERIYDQSGNSWYDVSSWFWEVLLKNNPGPWWAVTVAERVDI